MKRTSLKALGAAGVFVAALAAIATWRFYGVLGAIPVTVSVTLWVMAVVCLYLALKVRSRRKDGRIGMDRSQLNPVMVAQFLVVGKASAWTGSLVGGAYVGMGIYILPQAGRLVAAANDVPGVVASALGGIALAAAGVFLERNCEVSPPPGSEGVR
ncbi:DUF3180 domain-containing protein [Corynebacterium lowii]|uniref:DUF3180 domain-containing protein n=1 Tax=Corynebacterium lowii TaxID=1544413 RepID=A0A0Q0U2U9_9CORY|nr:DUF3180 domain-containing protein [Corynebacterium lowii]KQB86192.1 hypothetical protein Clow_01546 [Corynebacterium lowii]MDP9852666.1 putative membrane channel-forming protein YqfA (hemolysin III family) [Corynebacterium lowii]